MRAPHILFVDDDPDIRELVQVVLQTAGFRVSTTDNAAAVLQRIATERFDVLLLDYWMPEVTASNSAGRFARLIKARRY